MRKEITCTECANRCHLTVEQFGDEIKVSGNGCPRGLKSGTEEFLGERATVQGVVRCGEQRIPVQTSKAVPKGMVYKVTLAIKKVKVQESVPAGTVLVENICGTGADLIVSLTDEKREA